MDKYMDNPNDSHSQRVSFASHIPPCLFPWSGSIYFIYGNIFWKKIFVVTFWKYLFHGLKVDIYCHGLEVSTLVVWKYLFS